ncbi:UNVERIFIED_ORG: hypothetical protein J2X79_003200 [Arthrobacter globiformis]|nr:hypothetical protein [Arthrobacter globiformis]
MRASELADGLGVHLVCAFVDPSGYLAEFDTPGRQHRRLGNRRRRSDKKRARVNALRFSLNQFDYEGKDTSVAYEPDPLIARRVRDAVGD